VLGCAAAPARDCDYAYRGCRQVLLLVERMLFQANEQSASSLRNLGAGGAYEKGRLFRFFEALVSQLAVATERQMDCVDAARFG
jgi:hypothetical protein